MKQVVLLKSRARNQGGLEKYSSRIAEAFMRRGHQVTLLTTDVPTDSPPIEGLTIQSIVPSRWSAFRRLDQFDAFAQKWIGKQKPDIVFGMDRNRIQTHIRAGNGVHAEFLESRLLSEGRWKYLSCLINPLHRKILSIEKAAFEHGGLIKIIANSHMVKKQILSRFATDPKKVQVIHNGVEWKEMQGDFDQWEIKRVEGIRKLGLKRDRYQFLFVGNGYRRKGLDPLLHALSKLPSKEFELSVVGKDKNLPSYQRLVEKLKLQDRVHFFGVSREIRLFYQVADALVIPSFYDPFANVTVEALAMGVFVVSSRTNGGHEVLSSQNGRIIEDILDLDALTFSLEHTLQKRKTPERALAIRNSIEYLDFSNQLATLIDACE